MGLYRANLSVKGMRRGEVVEIPDPDYAERLLAKGWVSPYQEFEVLIPEGPPRDPDHPAVQHAANLNPPVEVEPEPQTLGWPDPESKTAPPVTSNDDPGPEPMMSPPATKRPSKKAQAEQDAAAEGSDSSTEG